MGRELDVLPMVDLGGEVPSRPREDRPSEPPDFNTPDADVSRHTVLNLGGVEVLSQLGRDHLIVADTGRTKLIALHQRRDRRRPLMVYLELVATAGICLDGTGKTVKNDARDG